MRRTFTAEEKASVFELWKRTEQASSEIANIPGSKTRNDLHYVKGILAA